jgi:hypothetical protein
MSMSRNNKIVIIIGMIAVFAGNSAFAQRDTSKRDVTITSAFKPMLKDASKINFNPSPPVADTTKPKLNYNIPNQNMLLPYQPGSLKPLALNIDSGGKWDNSSYVKLGFGSLKTPYVQLGLSLGDGKTAGGNIFAKHVSSDGKRDFQDFTSTEVRLSGFFQTAKNIEWNVGVGMKQDKTWKYGYQPTTLVFTDDSLKQSFNTYSGKVGFHNINKTSFGLSYSPEIKIDVMSDDNKNSESNTVVNLPLEKTIGNQFAVKLGVTFDLTRLSPEDKAAINNTMYYLSPSVLYKSSKINIQAGIRPSWDNKTFKLFPNIIGDVSSPDNRFTFQAGWTGYIRKTTYQYLSSFNPWLDLPTSFNNTWIEERFAGFKGAVGNHFTYGAKVGFNKLNNQPLFVNNYSVADGGKTFIVVNEPRINVINMGGEIGVAIQEKFSWQASWQVNQYSGLKVNDKAWGLLPVELKSALRLQVVKDLWLKSDLFAWGGPKYQRADGSDGRLKGAFDLNAGLEFRITKALNLWAQFNNLTNKEYQRWNQYPVYGFNFAGGIVFSFAQLTK